MVSAKCDDFCEVLHAAVKNGQQLLVLDVEPLDGEMNFGNLEAVFQWKTGFINGCEQLFVKSDTNNPGPATNDPTLVLEGMTTNQETTIPIHHSFRIVLTSHQPHSAFGDAILKIPTLDAAIHDAEIHDMLLDKMWNLGLQQSSSSTSEPTIKLKLALREFSLLSSKALKMQSHLTKLIQEVAVHGDFQLPEMEKLREQSNTNRELHVALQRKRMEVENEISKTRSKLVTFARVGAAALNSFNAAVSTRRIAVSQQQQRRTSPPLAFQLFLPMYFSTLSSSTTSNLLNSSGRLVPAPPPMHSAASSRSGFTRGGGQQQLQQVNQGQGALSRGPSRLLTSTTQHNNDSSLNTVPEVLTQILNLLMPLVSCQNDWYRFVLEFVLALEAENQQYHHAKKQPKTIQRSDTVKPISELMHAAGDEAEGNEDGEVTNTPDEIEADGGLPEEAAASSSHGGNASAVETMLMLRKLRRWDISSSSQELGGILQELRALEPKSVASMMINGVTSGGEAGGPAKISSMMQLFDQSRPRFERIKIGLTLLPQLTYELCDQMLKFYGAHVKFTKDDDVTLPLFSSSAQHEQQEFGVISKTLQSTISRANVKHGWLRHIAVLPEIAGVLVVSKHSFHSFAFIERAFFQMIFIKEVRVALLQQLFARSLRASAELLGEVFTLPKSVALSNPALRESGGVGADLSTNPLLLIRELDEIRKLEMEKSNVLETTPLALVNMQFNVNPEHWEGLFQILHRTYQHTTSAAFKRYYSQVEQQNQMKPKLSQLPPSALATSSSVPPSSAPPPNSVLTTLRAPTTRRLSTAQSLVHRHSDISLVTMAYPRLLAVVDSWQVLPVHLQKNLLCLHDEHTGSLYSSTALRSATSFKRCVQSTLLRFAFHPCRELLQNALSVDESSKAKAAFAATGGHDPQVLLKSMAELRAPSTWQSLSSLILFHALLIFRSNLTLLSHGGPHTKSYDFDNFVTAVNQLPQTLAQLKTTKDMTKESIFERFQQQVVLSAYSRAPVSSAGGYCEVSFLTQLYRECFSLTDCGVQFNSEASVAGSHGSSKGSSLSVDPPPLEGSSRPANITIQRQNSTMRNLVRRTSSSFSVGGNTLLGASSSPSSLVSSPRAGVPRLPGLSASSALGFLEFPLETLYLNTSDVDQWLELCWEFSETLEKRHDAQLRKLFTGCSEFFGMGFAFKHSLQGEDFGLTVTLTEAEEFVQSLLEQPAIATQFVVVDSSAVDHASDTQGLSSGSSSLKADNLVGLIQTAFLDRFNKGAAQIHRFLTDLLHEIRSPAQQQSRANASQVSANQAQTSLLSIRNPNIRDQLLTLLRNEISAELYQSIDPQERSLSVTSQWSLSDLLAHYQCWRHSLLANNRESNYRTSPAWWFWAPALFSSVTMAHIIETAKLSYCEIQTLDAEVYSVSYSLHLLIEEEERSVETEALLPPQADQNQQLQLNQDQNFPENTFAVFDGLCVVGATWNADFGYVEPFHEREVPR